MSTADFEYKVELYRDGMLVQTYAPYSPPRYWSDQGLTPNTRYYYQIKWYKRYAGGEDWIFLDGTGSGIYVDTSVCYGKLYNGTTNLFNRPPVIWRGQITLGGLNVKQGTLHMEPDTVVTFVSDHGFIRAFEGDALICADGATFYGWQDDFGYCAEIDVQGTPGSAIFTGCVLDKFTLCAYGGNVVMVNNVFSNTEISLQAGNSLLMGNTLDKVVIGDSRFSEQAAGSHLLSNTINQLDVYASNIVVEANHAANAKIWYS